MVYGREKSCNDRCIYLKYSAISDRLINDILKLNNEVFKELKLGAGDLSTDESVAPFSILVEI